MSIEEATIQDVRKAEGVIRQHLSPAPLIRSYALEKELDNRNIETKYNENQIKRHSCVPGITGLAQICGRNKIDWEKRLNLDEVAKLTLSLPI